MALSRLLVTVFRSEYETLAVGEWEDWLMCGPADLDSWTGADRTALKGARFAAVNREVSTLSAYFH